MKDKWLFEKTLRIKYEGIALFVSKLHGKFYATLVILDADHKPSAMSVLGPYNTERQAEKEGNKWAKLNNELIKRGEPGHMPQLKTVPDEVREYIMRDIRAALEQHKDAALSRNVRFWRAPRLRQ